MVVQIGGRLTMQGDVLCGTGAQAQHGPLRTAGRSCFTWQFDRTKVTNDALFGGYILGSQKGDKIPGMSGLVIEAFDSRTMRATYIRC